MNRAEMIEKAANVLPYHWRTNPPGGKCSCGHETPLGQQCSEHVAQVVLHAILPQVTTVEELEACDANTAIAVDKNGLAWHLTREGYEQIGGRTAYFIRNVFLDHVGPLTVVWQP